MEIARLAAFLKEQPQVGNLNTINVLMFNLVQNKLFIRQLAKPVQGVGAECLAIRMQALTRAKVGNLQGVLTRMKINHMTKGNIK